MKKQGLIYFWIIFVAVAGLSLAYIYKSEGAKSVADLIVVWVMIYFGVDLIHRLTRSYPISMKNGWNVIGPDPNALIFIGAPVFNALIVILQHWVDHYFAFDTDHFSYSYLWTIYIDQPLFSIVVISLVLFGILKIFVNRLRWNDQAIEYRNLFFQTQTVRWDAIDRIVLGGALVGNEVVLKTGVRISFPHLTGLAGADQLEADARARGIFMVTANKTTDSTLVV